MCRDPAHRHTGRDGHGDGGDTDTHAGYGIHRSSYVRAIINKSENARLQQRTENAEVPEAGGGEEAGGRADQGHEGGGSQLATLGANNEDSCHWKHVRSRKHKRRRMIIRMMPVPQFSLSTEIIPAAHLV